MSIIPKWSYANTTIITIRTGNAVFIGADSKAVPLPTPKCKIEQAGDIFFAITGSPAFFFQWIEISGERQETIFDFHDVIRTIGMTNFSIDDKVSQIETVLRSTLLFMLENMQRIDQKTFCANYPRDKIVLGVVIAGIENNIPVFYVREARITTECIEPVAIDIKIVNHSEPPKSINVNISGEQDAILKNKIPSSIADDEIVFYIKKWIDLEIKVRPDIVGPPINIISITKNGAKWIQKDGCKDITNTSHNKSIKQTGN